MVDNVYGFVNISIGNSNIANLNCLIYNLALLTHNQYTMIFNTIITVPTTTKYTIIFANCNVIIVDILSYIVWRKYIIPQNVSVKWDITALLNNLVCMKLYTLSSSNKYVEF